MYLPGPVRGSDIFLTKHVSLSLFSSMAWSDVMANEISERIILRICRASLKSRRFGSLFCIWLRIVQGSSRRYRAIFADMAAAFAGTQAALARTGAGF